MRSNSIDEKAIAHCRERIAKNSLPENSPYCDIVTPLLERLDYILIQPTTILNIGWQAQAMRDALQKRYPVATVVDIVDPAVLSIIQDQSQDLIILHFALLCEKNPTQLLKTCHRLLRTEGLLLFVECGPDTLQELRASFAAVDSAPRVHRFPDMHDVGDWLRGLQFSDPVMDREMLTFAYDDLNTFFKELKAVGLMNANLDRSRGLLSKNKYREMMLHYEALKQQDYYPVSFEIIYGHGWKTEVKASADEIYIAIDSIQRR